MSPDKIIYPACTLCRDHQRGFIEGVKIGVLLREELTGEQKFESYCETYK